MSCAAKLYKHELEHDEAQCKFDLQRDEVQRRFIASMLGVKLEDEPTKAHKNQATDGRKQTMTQQDIMRNYAK